MAFPVSEPCFPRVRLTVTGTWCLFLGIFLLVAAGNTGNNMLFLMSSGLLSLLIINTSVAIFNLRRVRLSWEKVSDGIAGQPLEAGVRVENAGGHPVGLLCLEEELLGGLEPSDSFLLNIHRVPEHRGRFSLGKARVTSLFPLGLVITTRTLEPAETWIYPAPRAYRLIGGDEGAPVARLLRADAAGDYYMHRPYQPGEDARHIDWQASARGDHEWVTLRALPFADPTRFWIDTFMRPPIDGEPFLGCVVKLLMNLHRSGSQAIFWLPEENGGAWLPIQDRHALTRCFRLLATCDLRVPAVPPVEAGSGRVMRLSSESLLEERQKPDFAKIHSAGIRS
ncbi:MAG: DUF58 domain-containing protein [Candidatus Ozemobacteraceae bacterium]